MIKQLFVIGFSAAALITTPALAQTAQYDGAARAMPVRYSDLDLRQSQDAAALLSRLQQAATSSCTPSQAANSNPRMRRAIDRCRQEAVASAVARINQQELTRLHAERR
jgi:UrcA family protein